MRAERTCAQGKIAPYGKDRGQGAPVRLAHGSTGSLEMRVREPLKVLTTVQDSSRVFLETSCHIFCTVQESDFKM